MANTIKTGTILIREGALLPESLLIESEPYAPGWSFNFLEITQVVAERFLWLPFVTVSVRSRHIQESPVLFGN